MSHASENHKLIQQDIFFRGSFYSKAAGHLAFIVYDVERNLVAKGGDTLSVVGIKFIPLSDF